MLLPSTVGVGGGGVEVAGWVTKGSNSDVDVAVYSGNGVGVYGSCTKTGVKYTSGAGDATISGTPPFGVGV